LNPVSARRLRQARLAAGLTLQATSDRLARLGLRLTRAALHKYEGGKSKPSPRALLCLAQVLDVPAEALLAESKLEIEWLAFRSHASLGKAAAARVQAIAARKVEAQLHLAQLLGQRTTPRFPSRQAVRNPDDAERLAEALRRTWNLGEAPLESLTQTIEDRGGVVVEVAEVRAGFDGLSGFANGRHPVIVVNDRAPGDRRRYTLAHELGHLAMTCDRVPGERQEPFAHRFAGAFVVPAPVARRELGARRRHLGFEELKHLKLKYGLSIQAWVRRALDLDIISESTYRSLCRQIGILGWRRTEPVVYEGERASARLQQLLLRALSEGVITRIEAEQIQPGIAQEAEAAQAPLARRARDLLYASDADRDQAMSRAAEALTADYSTGGVLRDFDAFGEKDLHDGDAEE
jgi:Zn-dependent peptidase ImmA (M78 family)